MLRAENEAYAHAGIAPATKRACRADLDHLKRDGRHAWPARPAVDSHVRSLNRSDVSNSIWPMYEAGRDQRTTEPDCGSVQVPALRCFVPKSKLMPS
jgi:hypothetical protein